MSGALNAFHGRNTGTPGTVTLDATYAPTAAGSGVQSASFSLESDGDIAINGSDVGDWLSPKSAAPSLYEVRATVVSGSVSSGTTGSWLALTSTRTWTRLDSDNNGSAQECVLTIEVRYNGGAVLDSSTVTLTANRTG